MNTRCHEKEVTTHSTYALLPAFYGVQVESHTTGGTTQSRIHIAKYTRTRDVKTDLFRSQKRKVFRKIDPVAKRSPAATAATVLAAAMSPPGTPPRLNKAVPVDTVSHGAYDQTDTPSRIGDGNGKGFPNAATPTPRKSPNPFNDESELVSPGDGVHGRDGGTRFRSGDEGVGQKVHAPDDFAASASSPSHLDAGMSKQSETNNQNQKVRPASPDARAIPLPSFGLLNAHTGPGSGAGSGERPDQKRSASKYDPRHDDDGARRILAFEHARGDVSPWHRDDHRNDGGHARSIHFLSRGSIRDRHDRQRVYSSASSSPAMRVMGHGGSVQSTPGEYADGNAHLDSDGNLDHTESPHAKRGLGFVERPLSHQTDAVRWDHERRSPQLTRLVTLSERSDEGSQGAHSMSVSVSSQPRYVLGLSQIPALFAHTRLTFSLLQSARAGGAAKTATVKA